MNIRAFLFIMFVCIVVVLSQNSLFYVFFGADLNPNMLWALIFSLYLHEKNYYSYLTAIIGGIFADMLGVGVIGFFSVLSVFFIILGNYFKKYLMRGLLMQIIFFYVLSIIFEFLYKTPSFVFKPLSPIQALLTTLCMLFFYFIEKRFISTSNNLNETAIFRRNK